MQHSKSRKVLSNNSPGIQLTLQKTKSSKSIIQQQLQGGGEITGTGESKKLLNEGKKYLYGKGNNPVNIQRAFDSFSEVLSREPNNAQAYQLRGQCRFEQRDYINAAYDFQMSIKNDKTNKQDLAEHMCWAGKSFIEAGRLDDGIVMFDKAIKNNKENGQYYFQRAKVKQKINKLEEAIIDYHNSIEKIGGNDQQTVWQSHFNKGFCLLQLQRTDEAITDFRACVDKQPDKAPGFDNLGLALFDRGQFEEAFTAFHRAIQLDDQAQYFSHRGLTLFELKKHEESLNDFYQAIKRNPEESLFYYHRGNVFLSLERFEEAHRDYDQATFILDNEPKYWHSKGLAYEGQCKQAKDSENQSKYRDKAIDMYKRALYCTENNFISSEFHLGVMYHQTNQFNLALKHLSNVVSKIPLDHNVYLARGQVYQDMGNHQFALKDFDKSVQLSPEDPDSLFHRGISKLNCKFYDEALEDFKESKDKILEGENPGIYDGQGQCYHALQKYDESLNFYNQALSIQPKEIKFLMNRANTYYVLHQNQDAINDLNSALQFSPTDPQILYRLGLAYYKLPNFKRCIRILKKAIKCSPFVTYEADIYYHVALAYANLDKYERSLYPFSKCVEMIPSDIRFLHERAKAYQMIEFHREALQDFSMVIKKNPKNAHAYFRRAFSNKALGNYQQAADDFERAKQLDPLNPSLVLNYKKMKGINCIVLCKPGEEKIFD